MDEANRKNGITREEAKDIAVRLACSPIRRTSHKGKRPTLIIKAKRVYNRTFHKNGGAV